MTLHPGRDMLLAHVDGELPERDERRISGHVAGCATCAAIVTGLRVEGRLFAGALHTLDLNEPTAWRRSAVRAGAEAAPGDIERAEATVAARAGKHAGANGVLPLRPGVARAPGRAPRRSAALRWAAGILLLAGATTYAAVIGVRGFAGADPVVPAGAEPAVIEPGVAAVTVSPAGGELRVAVSGAGAGSRLYITVEDRTDANVAVESAGSPRFTVVGGRVDVDLGSVTAAVHVTLPRTLHAATVTAEGSTVVSVQGGRVSPAEAAGAGVPLDGAEGTRME